jgi:two-component system chemotaxis response regulator CheV
MANNILLEAGTNEMELLVFMLDKTYFGINVAKVREIIQRVRAIPVPYAPPEVEGIFKLRDEVLTLVNIGQYFSMEGAETSEGHGSIIVVEFNKIRCGILVDNVEVIHRINWDKIESPSPYLVKVGCPITGTVLLNGKTVIIVDFETLVVDLLGILNTTIPDAPEFVLPRRDVRILVADDSSVIRSSLIQVLSRYGFENLTVCSNGLQAWEVIRERYEEKNGPFDVVLTDIEMPEMDGLHLTRKIKEDPKINAMPVVLFSSLISDDNRNKGQAVRADAQVSKPDSEEMIQAIEKCLEKRDLLVTSN